MSKFTYYVDGLDIEVSAVAATQREAHKLAWASLTDEQKNAARCLEWIDTQPAPAFELIEVAA